MLFLFSNPNNEYESVHVLELMKYCITVIRQLSIQEISDCEEKLVDIFKHFSSNDQISAGSKKYLEVLNLSRILALSGEYREARCNKLLKVLGKYNHEKAMESDCFQNLQGKA